MQELFSDNPEEILQELNDLAREATPLTLYQKGSKPRLLTVSSVEEKEGAMLLILEKLEPFKAPEHPSILLYHPQGKPVRGFSITPILETAKQVGAIPPSKIFVVQRRRHPRYRTTRSTATFTRLGGSSVNSGEVVDISLEGANLSGPFSGHIRKGETLGRITFTLRLPLGDYEEQLTVDRATVRYCHDPNETLRRLGVHFQLTDTEKAKLETFLALLELATGS